MLKHWAIRVHNSLGGAYCAFLKKCNGTITMVLLGDKTAGQMHAYLADTVNGLFVANHET